MKAIYDTVKKVKNVIQIMTVYLLSALLLQLSYNLVTICTGGMPPTPQAVQIAGQKQNQQQYDPSKGPPVQNAASLHTPPPQLPGRLPQGALPMAGLPMTLSQQAQCVDNPAQPGGQLQAQVKVQAGGAVLAAGNPHTQLQAQLQQQLQSGLHLQLQPQQQQSQAILQTGQVVSLTVGWGLNGTVAFSFFSSHPTNPSFSPCTDGGPRSSQRGDEPTSSEDHDEFGVPDVGAPRPPLGSQLRFSAARCKSAPYGRRQRQPGCPVQAGGNQWHLGCENRRLQSKCGHAVVAGRWFSGQAS